MVRNARDRRRRRALPDLKRPQARLESRRRFFLFVEGRNTEPAYFKALQRAVRTALIEIVTKPGVGVPMTIAEKAVERSLELGLSPKSRRKKDSYEERDQIWAVFDRDEHPRFDEAVALCQTHRIGVGRSNPCFELWLILHKRDYDSYVDRHAVQIQLKSLCPEYELDGSKLPDCDALVTSVEAAERRGETQLRCRTEEDRPFGIPSTTVGRLTNAIREAAKLTL